VNTALRKAKIKLRGITHRTHNTQSISNIQHSFNIRQIHQPHTTSAPFLWLDLIKHHGLTRKHSYRAVINRPTDVFVCYLCMTTVLRRVGKICYL